VSNSVDGVKRQTEVSADRKYGAGAELTYRKEMTTALKLPWRCLHHTPEGAAGQKPSALIRTDPSVSWRSIAIRTVYMPNSTAVGNSEPATIQRFFRSCRLYLHGQNRKLVIGIDPGRGRMVSVPLPAASSDGSSNLPIASGRGSLP